MLVQNLRHLRICRSALAAIWLAGSASLGFGQTVATIAAVLPEPLIIDPQPVVELNAATVAFSPDGQLVAAGFGGLYAKNPNDRQGGIVIWDAASGERRHLVRETGDILRLAFTHDGKHLCYARIYMAGDSVDLDVVAAIDVATGKVRQVHDRSGQFAISSAADTIVAGTYNADLFDAADFHLLRKVAQRPLGKGRQLARCYALSPDGRWLVEDASQLRLYDTQSGEEIRTSDDAQGGWPVSFAATFAPDGKTVCTGGRDGVARIYDVETLAELRRLDCGQEVNVYPFFSPDGKTVALGTQPAESIRWKRNRNTPRGYETETYRIGTECQVVFFDAQSFLETARWRFPHGRLKTYNSHAATPKARWSDGVYPEYNPQRFAYSADGSQLLVGCSGVTLLDTATGKVLRRYEK